ncbi:immunoglobulin lambda-1 light chain-like [Chiloscyllium plagiosum]|uniref:immunoglobulin lambda-1 light chain-like n=1 Tax=Chiloscyllium plagiosum TaxID=36176 RepID=UPI001CB7DE94|nr:immunoglobulin lambda-1 light chain-like [Chiloscyllium plagiosum]
MSQWVCLISTLLIAAVCSNGQITLTQPKSVSIEPQGTVKFSCSVSGENLGNSDIGWYQQKPGTAPRFLLYHDLNRDSRGSGVPDRFSGRSQSSTNAAYLTISRVQPEDDANYYCGWWKSNAFYFGGGTKLTVLTREATRPSVSLLPPSPDQISADDTATLVCLVNHFFPGSVEVSWSVDGETTDSGVQTTQAVRGTDQTYSVSSYLTLTAAQWNSHEVYTCGVTHESLASQLKQSIKRSGCE